MRSLKSSKKRDQLGMDPGTAQHKLSRDILFDFVKKSGHKCYRCGGEMTREDFSVEHKEPWLDSADPFNMFFDLSNIAYSHFLCNVLSARRVNKIHKDAKAGSAATSRKYREVHRDKVLQEKKDYRLRKKQESSLPL